ncbi:hypothetical protein HYALB_00012330 [Hymenoscyphus albidus]|uniref:Uncharacterized protein n=1 Tax=Hymenoscyphus albidus TaxID=595503 RepID=A0A9N9PUC8_9HELO|nr:hypothetical protein HYALB_00012330 [Hymenoscyphus albidus]
MQLSGRHLSFNGEAVGLLHDNFIKDKAAEFDRRETAIDYERSIKEKCQKCWKKCMVEVFVWIEMRN